MLGQYSQPYSVQAVLEGCRCPPYLLDRSCPLHGKKTVMWQHGFPRGNVKVRALVHAPWEQE